MLADIVALSAVYWLAVLSRHIFLEKCGSVFAIGVLDYLAAGAPLFFWRGILSEKSSPLSPGGAFRLLCRAQESPPAGSSALSNTAALESRSAASSAKRKYFSGRMIFRPCWAVWRRHLKLQARASPIMRSSPCPISQTRSPGAPFRSTTADSPRIADSRYAGILQLRNLRAGHRR
jgi:hypothetical protein